MKLLAVLLSLLTSVSGSLFAFEARSFVVPPTLPGYADLIKQVDAALDEHALPRIGYHYCPEGISKEVSEAIARDIPFTAEESLSLPFDASCNIRVSSHPADASVIDLEVDLDADPGKVSLATSIPSASSLLFVYYPPDPSESPSLIAVQIKTGG